MEAGKNCWEVYQEKWWPSSLCFIFFYNLSRELLQLSVF